MLSFKENLPSQRGIAVILSVIILTALMGLIISAATVSSRVTKSSQSLNASEAAFFAAESGVELTIYEIEKNGRGLDLLDITGQPMAELPGAVWDRQVRLDTTTPGLCSAARPKPLCSVSVGSILTSNPLTVTLLPGQSLQFDLNIAGTFYPDRIRLSWPGSASAEVKTTGPAGQTIETVSPLEIPSPPEAILPEDNYRFRLINTGSSVATYTITPQGGGTVPLPLGLDIAAAGHYQQTERRLEVTRPSWLIY